MCVCSPQKVIVPYSNTNIQNNGMNVCNSNLIINNNNKIESINKQDNNNNAIVIKNEKNIDAETYNNIQSNGQSTPTPKPRRNSNFSQIMAKKENNQNNEKNQNDQKSQKSKKSKKSEKSQKNQNDQSDDQKCKSDKNNQNKDLQKRRKSKSKKRASQASVNNNNTKEEDYEKIIISETILSELTINEKIKTLAKEKKKKLKGRNIVNIVIIGFNEVGKSSFCIRLVENKFENFYIPSICNETFSKIMIYNEHNYRVNFSVILGGKKIQSQDNILNTADFFLLIYDITKIRSYNQMNIYLDQIKKFLFFYDKDGKKPNFCLVGNKLDLEKERKVDMEIVNKFTKKYNVTHFDISIKTGNNINNIIPFLLKIFDKYSFSSK